MVFSSRDEKSAADVARSRKGGQFVAAGIRGGFRDNSLTRLEFPRSDGG